MLYSIGTLFSEVHHRYVSSLDTHNLNETKGCVTLVALPFYIKKYLKAKEEEELMKTLTTQAKQTKL